jgi:hypothetical protein
LDLDAARRIAAEELARRPGGHNDLEDAQRHAEWQRRVTHEVNETTAGWAGYGHELENLLEGSPWHEILMDLHNNRIGREAGRTGGPIDRNRSS